MHAVGAATPAVVELNRLIGRETSLPILSSTTQTVPEDRRMADMSDLESSARIDAAVSAIVASNPDVSADEARRVLAVVSRLDASRKLPGTFIEFIMAKGATALAGNNACGGGNNACGGGAQ